MSLANGQSEIDTVVLRLPDSGKEIRNWERYSFNQKFLVPTAGWTFQVSDEDPTLTNDLLVPNARVQLVINDRIQCTGFIDRKSVDADASGGTTITVQGRDILGPVCDATMDPRWKFASGMTIVDVVLGVLGPFGITTLYNADVFNLSVITGYQKGTRPGPVQKTTFQVANYVVQADGSLKNVPMSVDGFIQVDNTRPDLKKLPLEQAKPHAGEGCFAYLERLMRRLGLTMWALADGSGVVLDTADFTSAPEQQIVHKRTDTTKNNVVRGRVEVDVASQPSAIVATGFGGGRDTEKSKLRVIMVNELTGLDETGKPLPEVQNVIGRYKSAKLLPIRPQLVPLRRPTGDRKIARIFHLKDDESRNLAQLEAFVRREMANRQQHALQVSYDVVGHTSGGHPWGVNTAVAVDDDVLGVHETLWVLEKTFVKSVSGGTMSSLKLIRPYTLQIAQ